MTMCSNCSGTGKRDDSAMGDMHYNEWDCPVCKGSGEIGCSIDLKKLIALRDEYLATLDNSDKDEIYDTDRGMNALGLNNFINWLNLKNWTPI